jgi:hypothetical protein
MMRLLCFSFGVVPIALVLGCSKPSTDGVVSGTVTLDSQPLKAGTVRFDAVDNRTPAADASISDGKFTAKVPPGDKRVTITSPKVVGKRKMYDTPDSPVFDVTEESLPRRYNAQTELKLTVIAGDQDATFDLKSK